MHFYSGRSKTYITGWMHHAVVSITQPSSQYGNYRGNDHLGLSVLIQDQAVQNPTMAGGWVGLY